MWTTADQRAYMKRRRDDARAEGLCIVCLRRPARYIGDRLACECKACAKKRAQAKHWPRATREAA